jgi:hypothetical protein
VLLETAICRQRGRASSIQIFDTPFIIGANPKIRYDVARLDGPVPTPRIERLYFLLSVKPVVADLVKGHRANRIDAPFHRRFSSTSAQ